MIVRNCWCQFLNKNSTLSRVLTGSRLVKSERNYSPGLKEKPIKGLTLIWRRNMASSSNIIKPADRLKLLPASVWVEFGGLVRDYKPINLGQGFPDFAITPECVAKALLKTQGPNTVFQNQYTRSQGHPRLVKAIADLYSPMFQRELNPLTQVVTTVGAYEALYCTIMSMISPGDEVILIEPYFDCYWPMVKMAGGIPVCVPLRAKPDAKTSADLYLDKSELEAAFNEKTKAIIINTPHNPTGKVFSNEEIEFIADLCKKFNCLYISDEVYEWLVYEGKEHVRAATLPGMWDRTVTICSAGKTFSLTGWKIGWAIASDQLIKNVSAIHSQCIYTIATPLQEALAEGLEYERQLIGNDKSYWKLLVDTLEDKKAKTAKMIEASGMRPIVPEGGYFMMADVSSLGLELEDDGSGKTYDYRFAIWLLKEKGIAVIPSSPFYSDDHKDLGSKYIRFCFIKEDSTLEKAAEILTNLNLSK